MINIKTDPGIPEEFRGKDPQWWIDSMLDDLFFLCTVVLHYGKKKEYRDLNQIHLDLCDFLDFEKNPVPQKLVLMFRDSLKSSIARAFVIQWFLKKFVAHEKGKAFIYCGVYDLAEDHADIIVNEIINNELLQAFFHQYLPKKRSDFDVVALDKGKIKHNGVELHLGSPEKPLTGRHFELGINDNLVNEKNSQTTEGREKINGRWRAQEAILAEDAWEIIFETPWFPDDLSGVNLDPDGRFDYQTIKNKPAHTFISSTGYAVFSCPARNENGDPVFPEKTDDKYLKRKRNKMGSYLYSALYDCQPIADEDRVFRTSWIVHYASLPENYIRNMCVDCSGTKSKESTPSAISLVDWSETGQGNIVFAAKKKTTPTELLEWMEEVKYYSEEKEKRRITTIGIEREKFSISLHSLIRTTRWEFLYKYIILIDLRNLPRPTRLDTLVPEYEMGNILSKPGLTDYEDEVKTYFRKKEKGTDILDTIWGQFEIKMIPQRIQKSKYAPRFVSIEPNIPEDFKREIERRNEQLAGSRKQITRMF